MMSSASSWLESRVTRSVPLRRQKRALLLWENHVAGAVASAAVRHGAAVALVAVIAVIVEHVVLRPNRPKKRPGVLWQKKRHVAGLVQTRRSLIRFPRNGCG